jgi:hypothetical protein
MAFPIKSKIFFYFIGVLGTIFLLNWAKDGNGFGEYTKIHKIFIFKSHALKNLPTVLFSYSKPRTSR